MEREKRKSFGYRRNAYLKELERYRNSTIIKVIVGMRRSGKSILLRQFIEELKTAHFVPEKNILYIDKESLKFDFLKTYSDLYAFVRDHFSNVEGERYLIVDEVQEIVSWEKAIASLHNEGLNVSISGSNAHMWSSDLATLLSGRYVKIPVYTLSFTEFLEFHQKEGSQQSFKEYLQLGGFPALTLFSGDRAACYTLIGDIFETILLNDIIARHNVRNIHLLQNILRYAVDNIGKTFSAKSVADYLKSHRMKLSIDTVYEYLRYLTLTYALHKVQRWDVRGKRHLEISEKYYLGDLSLRHSLLGYRENDIDVFLENIVHLELLRRGYKVSIGKIDGREIDFIAEKFDEKLYVQVCYLLATKEGFQREFAVLKKVPDNYPKMVLSLDESLLGNCVEGIERKNLVNWLMN